MDQSPSPRARFGLGFVIGFLVSGVLLGVAGIVLFVVSGGPVADEWACSRGEFPTSTGCLPYGTRVPAGNTAYPNGPLS